MFNPVSTYRLQFHDGFKLDDLQKLIAYFEKLGIKTIYASPVFRSVPGSKHGYDGVNPNQVNPEIGTTEQLKELSALLAEKGISWIQDIVPNHMAFHHHNEWLMDVLEKGNTSEFVSYFDSWSTEEHKIMVPFLGEGLKDSINDKKLSLVHHEQKICFDYSGMFFPLNAHSRARVLQLHEDIGIAVNMANENTGLLLELANAQYYKFTNWKESETNINYRRFFTVNGLICLNAQQQEVFNATHKLIACLLKKNVFKGLRIDHIDGLYDPAEYLERLRAIGGEELYIIVEKILGQSELLPAWPMQGNTGYDFLAFVNNLLTNKNAEESFTGFYTKITRSNAMISKSAHEKKAFILYQNMGGELDHLTDLFKELIPAKELGTVQADQFRKAIGEFLIHCPVYRFYGNEFPLGETEAGGLKEITGSLKHTSEELAPAISLLEQILLEENPDELQRQKTLHFYKRCMQFTGPLMAKGIEDTLMYTHNRFIAHNDVGDSPGTFGITAAEFHEQMTTRCENWPLTLNATSTHDTKRGEDARARLNVLTDLAQEWIEAVSEWQELNKGLKEKNFPDPNDEYFIYQTLIGTYPFSDEDTFEERLKEYIPKALREAKVHSQWSQHDETYEKATLNFAINLLNKESRFWKSFKKIHAKICDHGIINSLTQLILKHTCPGVPDTYQGTELWDLSLVDPDNRRAVDYFSRQNYLDEFEQNKEPADKLLEKLWQERDSGKIKLYFLQMLLCLRKQEPEVFEKGFYIPLQVTGKHKEHIIAFARRHEKKWCVVVLPLHTALLKQETNNCEFEWEDTRVLLPDEMPCECEDVLLKKKQKASKQLFINNLFATLPFAVLKMQHPVNERSAGVLLPVSALPSGFSIGDLGAGAKNFVDFLSRSSQTYWQLLPLNPTEEGSGYSPYSSSSSMAGNALLISPEILVKEGLLTDEDLKEFPIAATGKTDYPKAYMVKGALFKKAFDRFTEGRFETLKKEFRLFIEKETYWLEDFACYKLLKKQHSNSPWFKWPQESRIKNEALIKKIKQENKEPVDYIFWEQFIFHRQWKELKDYCHRSGIKLFGDLPFYVSHDSADVWANQEIFSLDEQGAISGIAGVPPDYFSKTGQLWNMPTFRWDKLKHQNYKWWIDRLSKNLQLFDLLRIDHFRALAEYWEVPAGEETAVNGKWIAGPGEDFFNAVKEALGDLPFIAEDLGDNMEKVYKLREAVNLPGMKVLQFAFGDNLPTAVDAPHNFTTNCIVYTGTHDNNTTLGWYRHETTKDDRKRIEKYTGKRITENNINDALAETAYASVAKTVVLPLQDLLGLDESSRMNTPGNNEKNWLWRLKEDQLNEKLETKLRGWTTFYNRI